jgi:DNA-binding LytR/AlgR family response regulator
MLRRRHFLRIHRSHIVNLRRIAQLWSIAHGQYVMELKSGQRLAVRAHLRRANPQRAYEPLLI